MRNLLIVLLALGAALSPAVSFAANSYYVEIGGDGTKDEAVKQWNDLAQKHKTLLGKLHFYPKAVIHSGSTVSTRIQAGPIATKEKAQKICTKLFKEDVPCFVIEGLGSAPPTSMMNMSEESVKVVQLPWLSVAEAPPAPVQELPVADSTNAPAPAPKKGKKQADVEVAEAIRVPLTQEQDQQRNAKVMVKSLPDIKPAFASAHDGDSKYADESDDSGPGWLVIESFPAKDIAASFWEETRHANRKQVKKLRVRILQPVLGGGEPKTSLNIGPFTSSSAAYDFCRKGIQAKDRGLSCHFSTTAPGGDDLPKSVGQKPAADRLSDVVSAPAKQYWIQVASAASQEEALQQWEDIKAKNEDLIQGLRSSIAPSATDKGMYLVRVGPIEDHEEAVQSCAQMQQRGMDCSVVVASRKAGKR